MRLRSLKAIHRRLMRHLTGNSVILLYMWISVAIRITYTVQVHMHIHIHISVFGYQLLYSSLFDSHIFLDSSRFCRTTLAP